MLDRASKRSDRRGVLALVGIGTLATNLLMLCLWSWWAFGTHNGFADMSVDMLKDRNVRGVVADQIVDALQQQGMTEQVALAAGPALKPVVAEIVDTDAFKGLFYAGARQLHETIFLGVRSRLLVEVDDAGQMVKDSLDVVNPELADKIPDERARHRRRPVTGQAARHRRQDSVVHGVAALARGRRGHRVVHGGAHPLPRSAPNRVAHRRGPDGVGTVLDRGADRRSGRRVANGRRGGRPRRAAGRVPLGDARVHAHRPRCLERRHRDHDRRAGGRRGADPRPGPRSLGVGEGRVEPAEGARDPRCADHRRRRPRRGLPGSDGGGRGPFDRAGAGVHRTRRRPRRRGRPRLVGRRATVASRRPFATSR